MTTLPQRRSRAVLQQIAHRVMIERGLEPDFSPAALAELSKINSAAGKSAGTRDLRHLLWCSIDNDDSRDLDQLSVGEALPDGNTKLTVAVADVAALLHQGSALDAHAQENTTSVYTAGQIFPMLPEKLSTDLTSLNFDTDRLAVIVEMVFRPDGEMVKSDVSEGIVRNHAKLAYNSVAAWLDGKGPKPAPIGLVPGLAENIQLQHHFAQQLRARRHMRGALSLQTLEARPVFLGDILEDLRADESNVAKNLIEELMVAANGVTARFLEAHRSPSMRRVVRTPIHWDRIVELAALRKYVLPTEPDGVALEKFLVTARDANPADFPDLSLAVIKLLGAGEYVIELPGATAPG
ncbi:MAG: rnb, partial [Verrucomicrobia bacterium]|nr:rnb [Verrucomicrobiota bacterium]